MKRINSYLRMMNVGGDYPIPMSDVSYGENISNIDIALPLNGGKLQEDGTWLQETWKTSHEFAQELKAQAHANNQLYIPVVVNNREFLPLLLDPELQEVAANNLVELATSGRFDSPWDGVWLNLEGIPSSYKEQLSDFYYLLAQMLHTNDLPVGVAIRGIASDPGPDYDDAYSNDFEVVGQIADFVDLFCYGYWNPINDDIENRSISPYWWIRECIEYALSMGIPNDRLSLGLAVYSNIHPEGTSTRVGITYDKALEIAGENSKQWIESNEIGTIREIKVNLPVGHIWIHDVRTLRHGFDLVDVYDLLGANIFVLGMEDERIWDMIANCRRQIQTIGIDSLVAGRRTRDIVKFKRGIPLKGIPRIF